MSDVGARNPTISDPRLKQRVDASPEQKNEFLNLVRSNEDMGKDYIFELTPPTTEEIRNARPLATVLPHDALTHVMLIAVTLCARTGR
jgi:hypothetical protein